MIKNYVAFDLETTGLDVEKDCIIEVGALKVVDGKVKERFIEFIKPERPISALITNITGITNEMVASARSQKDVVGDFIDFCEDYVLLGHNLMFDYRFIKKQAVQSDICFEKKGLDTLKIARKVLKHVESKSLGALCEHYDVVNTAAHRAYHDALATAKIYHMLAHDFESGNEKVFVPEQLQYKPRKTQLCTAKQLEYLRTLSAYHNLKMQEHPEKLTRNEASKLIDHIILTYGKMF